MPLELVPLGAKRGNLQPENETYFIVVGQGHCFTQSQDRRLLRDTSWTVQTTEDAPENLPKFAKLRGCFWPQDEDRIANISMQKVPMLKLT